MEFSLVHEISKDSCPVPCVNLNVRYGSYTDPESFVRGVPTLTFLFLLVDEGREDPNTTQIGPSLAHQRSLADQWWPNIVCWLDIFVIFHEIWTSIDKEPCSFVIFQWGGGVWTPVLSL